MEGWGRHSRLGNGRSKGRQAGQEEAAGCVQGMERHWVWKTQAAVTTVGLGTVPLCRTGTHKLILFERSLLKRILFIYHFWLHWVCIARLRLSLVKVNGEGCVGFSSRWFLLLQSMGSGGSRAPEHRLGRCGAWP